MSILSVDDYLTAYRQQVLLRKTANRTTVAFNYFSVFDLAGNPGAGTLAGISTSSGVVPTSSVAGYPPINAFVGGATGYLSRAVFSFNSSGRFRLFDRLFVAGAYSFNASTTLSSPPSFSSRLPFKSDGVTVDYTGLEIWVETVTAATGNQTWNVTYTDQSGNTGHTTGAVGISAAPTLGRCWQLPLAAGDTGLQGITGVVGGTGSAGTANIMVLRPLWEGRTQAAGSGDTHDFIKTGMPQVFATSALYLLVEGDSTSTGLPETLFEIASK